MPKRGNKYAQKHGAFSSEIILPSEDPAEFENLRAEVYDEWKPEGPTEIEKANSMAINMWRKQRLRRYFKKAIDRAASAENEFAREDDRVVKGLVKIMDDIRRGIVKEKYLSMTLDPDSAQTIKQKHPRDKYNNDRDWLWAITMEIDGAINRYVRDASEVLTVEDGMSDEAFADRELSIEERIDAKIDKDIKQLAQIKTMKAIGICKPVR